MEKWSKNRNDQILSTFWPYIFCKNYFKVCKFNRCEYSPSFFNYFLLVFRIFTVQWLNCKNLKDELNCSYNGGGDAYILQSVAIHFKHTVFKSEHVCPSTKQMKYILRCWFLKVVQCSKELKIKINQVSFLCDVGDFATLV